MKWNWGQVTDVLWPEVVVGGGIGALTVLTRGWDARQGWDKPFKRTQEYAGTLGPIALGIMATAKSTSGSTMNDAGRAALTAEGALLFESVTATAYEQVAKRTQLAPRNGAEQLSPSVQAAVNEAAKLLNAGNKANNIKAPVGAGITLDFDTWG